jgi:hypothetical protein
MSHLSASEFIDLADGTLTPRRAAHVERCGACRAQAGVVQDALRLTDGEAAVPEPSPLFWDHLSARVREAIDAPSPRAAFGFGFRGLRPIVATLAIAVVVLSVMLLNRDARTNVTPRETAGVSTPSAADPDQLSDPALDPNHAAAWSVLTAAAEDLRLEEARDAGMAVPSAAVDRAVSGLTPAELSELGRLLQSELKRSSN